MDRTGNVYDNSPPSLGSESAPEELQSDGSEEFVCGLLLGVNTKKCNGDARRVK